IYRQIGNAFPPPVAKALGASIIAALNRTTERLERDPGIGDDPIYRVLRDSSDFMTASQIARAAKLKLEPHELERRISLLSRDFHIEIRNRNTSTAYKLGEFKAFLGQDDHIRNELFEQYRNRIS